MDHRDTRKSYIFSMHPNLLIVQKGNSETYTTNLYDNPNNLIIKSYKKVCLLKIPKPNTIQSVGQTCQETTSKKIDSRICKSFWWNHRMGKLSFKWSNSFGASDWRNKLSIMWFDVCIFCTLIGIPWHRRLWYHFTFIVHLFCCLVIILLFCHVCACIYK
jgi:hypothetical protein